MKTRERELDGVKALALFAALVSIGACASASAGRAASNAPPSRPGGIRFVYNVDVSHAWEEDRGRDGLLAGAVSVMRRRVDALFRQGAVRAAANGIEVVLPEGDPTTLERYRGIAQRPGRFQVRLVDDGSTYMAMLAERLRHEVYEFEGVAAAEDSWNEPKAGGSHRDSYLMAAHREDLVAVLRKLTAASPAPRDREILIETYGETSRSYFVATSGGIDNADIGAAAVAAGFDGRPEVLITLTAEGRRKFGDMTAAAVGRKIAIVIDGRIASAPMVAEPIRNGRAHLSLNIDPAVDPGALRAEAEDLAALLRSGPLPAPLSLEREELLTRGP